MVEKNGVKMDYISNKPELLLEITEVVDKVEVKVTEDKTMIYE